MTFLRLPSFGGLTKILLVFFLAGIYYLPTFNNYFFSDDFFNLQLSQVSNLPDFLNFFAFKRPTPVFSFYRPLPLQVFYFFHQKIFGLNPFFYHLTIFFLFLLSVIGLYLFISQLTQDKKLARLTSFIYLFSSPNFLRLAWIVQIQEILLALCYFTALYYYLKYRFDKANHHLILSLLFFSIGLFTKESIVTLPLTLLLLEIFLYLKNRPRKIFIGIKPLLLGFYLALGSLMLIYLYLRIIKIGLPQGNIYQFNFHPGQIVNTLGWYYLWSINVAEFFVDFIGPNLNLNLLLFRYHFRITLITLFCLLVLATGLIIGLINIFKLKKNEPKLLTSFSLLFFLLTLLPVLFLPWHKFSYALAVPSLGVSLLMAIVLSVGLNFNYSQLRCLKRRQFLALGVLSAYFFLGLNTNLFNLRHHWIFNRAKIAHQVLDYFQTHYPQPTDQPFYFINDRQSFSPDFAPARLIWEAVSGEIAFQILYRRPNLMVYFQAVNDQILPVKTMRINSSVFLD